MEQFFQKRYCDYDYDTNMIILFDPEDEEARSDDDFDIYWISDGKEKISDIPPPPMRTASKQRLKARAKTSARSESHGSAKKKVAKTQSFKLRVKGQGKGAAPRSSRAPRAATTKPNLTMTIPVALPQYALPNGAPFAAPPAAYGQIPAFAMNPMTAAHSGHLMNSAVPRPPMGRVPYFDGVPFQ
jgi:hypothetical protein